MLRFELLQLDLGQVFLILFLLGLWLQSSQLPRIFFLTLRYRQLGFAANLDVSQVGQGDTQNLLDPVLWLPFECILGMLLACLTCHFGLFVLSAN